MHISLGLLYTTLVILIIFATFFSSAETGMIALNRYRLRHLARQGHRAAIRAQKLLKNPDRLLGVILIANTTSNIISSVVMTIIAEHFFKNVGIAIATGIFTLFILVVTEVAPKTLAALYPEPIAFAATIPLTIILKILYPLVWLVNGLSNGLLKLVGVDLSGGKIEHLSTEELRTIVYEAGGKIPAGHQEMLLRILELEHVTVEDIMIPRTDIVGVDLEEPWETILEIVTQSQYTKLPVYEGNIQNIIGMLHIRSILNLTAEGKLTIETLKNALQEVYFIPEITPLHIQLLNFKRKKTRTGFVVDEYGEVLGLVTLEDILEEIVGEFTTDIAAALPDVHLQPDGSYLVDGSANIRDLNRSMNWHFSTEGPKTISGLIIEYLQMIPQAGICVRINHYPIEIIEVEGNLIRTIRIYTRQKTHSR